ncbi:hypothetical protein [Corallococcus aberystwythensis]|uniref:Tetratricopeptide repeat protein n=1 Tax=Corallococcus aberystwythensis TaxID=2316722 RepID=A0A3A8Q2M3_9BACT|nr:hypothetical protein [Corallococcus aberystwythensis]RKH62999.1 hypothetical protein D7W81_21275 [Corallococcus aberystwythensis]
MLLAPFVLAVLVAAQPVTAPGGVARSSDSPTVTYSGAVSAPPLVPSDEACAAESDYVAGFDALVRGEDARALEALERVLQVCPRHPYAPELARLARTRMEPGARLAQDTLARPVVSSEEGPSKGARASLTVVQTLHGITQGILLCEISDCQDTRAYVAVSLLGGGAGAAISLLATRSGMTQGQAAAINSGTVWGFGFGLASIGSFDLDGDSSTGAVMAGALGFTGLGILVAELARPTAGQVSLANSGGLWSGVVAALLMATQSNSDTRAFFGIEQGVVGAGLVTFALVSRNLDISRGRVLLIDAGGILGGLVGLSALFLALDDDHGDALLVGTAVGVVAGLGTATFLTRDFDGPDDAPAVSVVPATLGRHGGLGLAVLGQF